ncbi:Cytochrome P450 [Dillenia turbinata]|uniref:Cytochrome P450 n=1 Tax=Dillenia turbinata TaxID=194707 RepID=A0AAN8VMR6_9MAGN
MIFALTNNIICRAAFGEKCKDQREIISAFKEIVEVFTGFSVADLYPSLKWFHVLSGERPKIERLHRRFDRMLEAIIGAHKASTARKEKRDGEAEEDLIDVLLRIQEENALDFPLTNEDVKAVALVSALDLRNLIFVIKDESYSFVMYYVQEISLIVFIYRFVYNIVNILSLNKYREGSETLGPNKVNRFT